MSETNFDAGEIKALVFDIFGTVVDWRSSVIREGQKLSAQTGLQADWPALADAWRAGYQPAMQRARTRRDRVDQHRRPAPRDPRRTAAALRLDRA